MTGTPTTRGAFRDELVRLSGIAREAGHLVPHAMARAAGITTPTMRQYLKGTADPGNPWDRDKILMDVVNTLQIKPV